MLRHAGFSMRMAFAYAIKSPSQRRSCFATFHFIICSFENSFASLNTRNLSCIVFFSQRAQLVGFEGNGVHAKKLDSSAGIGNRNLKSYKTRPDLFQLLPWLSLKFFAQKHHQKDYRCDSSNNINIFLSSFFQI